MKKTISLFLAAVLVLFVMTGCAGNGAQQEKSDKLTIVTTIFPEYDWTRNILGDLAGGAELILLADNGTDFHMFQPAADDIIDISTCDVFIYSGGVSDQWVKDVLKEVEKNDIQTVDLMESMGDRLKEEEIVEGMQAEEDEGDGSEFDEHIWLSLKNASAACDAIADALCEADAEHADIYRDNAAAYKEKLDELDAGYTDSIASAELDTVVFGDRFPFRYLMDDYDIDYYAPFVGCSSESEASFDTICFLADKVNELDVPAVLVLENSDQKIADTVIKTSGRSDVEILKMDSIQAVKASDIENGPDYLEIMKNDLDVLKKALKARN